MTPEPAEPRTGAAAQNGRTIRPVATASVTSVATANARLRRDRPREATSEWRRPAGAMILILVVVAVILTPMLQGWISGDDDLIVVRGVGGQLKANFLNDPEVKEILAETYDLAVEIRVAGSIEMLNRACDDAWVAPHDYLWAGDQSTLDIYRGCNGEMVGFDNIYNSPMVIYSWTDIVDALVAAGLASLQSNGSYTLDFPALVEVMNRNGSWESIGLPRYHGEVLIHTSDPAKSNSGYLFAGMLANVLNGGAVVNMTSVDTTLPGVAGYFDRLGFMEPTSGDLFEQFLTTGRGAKPMIAAYESQLPEFLHDSPSFKDQVQQEVRILYPEPTVWATHPLIARNEAGSRLLAALKDPAIQALAWPRHGQRPGLPSIGIDPNAMGIPGIREHITSVIDLPETDVMDRIRDAISPPLEPQSPTASRTTVPLRDSRGRRAGRASPCRSGGCSRFRPWGGRRRTRRWRRLVQAGGSLCALGGHRRI